MYINCPSCNTQFMSSEEMLSRFNHRVRCSKCNFVWTIVKSDPPKPKRKSPVARSSDSISIATESKYIDTPINIHLPVVLKQKKGHNMMRYFAYGLVIFCILISVFFYHNQITSFFKCGHDLEVLNINISEDKEINSLSLRYYIVNKKDYNVKLENIHIDLLDENHKVLYSYEVDYDKFAIGPRNYLTVETIFFDTDDKVKYCSISTRNN